MLFKILQGNKANLPTTLTDGYCYYLRDEHYFYVDHKDPNGILVRSKLSAEYADKLRYTNTDGTIIEISPEDLALKTEMLRKVELTQAEYDALPVKDPNTLYIITDAQDANYVSEDQIGVANGVASLDSSGKVPSAQLPTMDYIPTSQIGAASGVASLNTNGKVPTGQMPSLADYGAAPTVHTHTKSQITDFPTSMPASDVSAWAKAASKPTYTASEVGAAAASHNHSAANITSGTLAAARGGTGQTTITPAVGTSALRAIYAGTGAMTASSTSLTTGLVYLQYE